MNLESKIVELEQLVIHLKLINDNPDYLSTEVLLNILYKQYGSVNEMIDVINNGGNLL